MNRRNFLINTTATGVATLSPYFFIKNAWADKDFVNNPKDSKSITLGFNVAQTGAYADELRGS